MRKYVAQFIVLIIVLLGFWCLWANLQENLTKLNIPTGFGFLKEQAGFNIIFHLIDYNESSSYFRAFLVGLLNTLLVSVNGIILASLLGFLLGVFRLSKINILSCLSLVYIEIIRNIPLLLQIFFWYFVVLRNLPAPRDSYSLFDCIYLNNRGLYLPSFIDTPKLAGFNFQGGINLIPEFLALLIALSTYTAAFIAEIVRASIIAIPKGQFDAGFALGLSNKQLSRLIIIPQAIRVALPPLTNQYLNLTKNSSLAAAIAYPDLVSVFSGTVLNQTGQAIEIISITMGVYLFLSITISLLMIKFESKTSWGKT